jgi:hypothetical protein
VGDHDATAYARELNAVGFTYSPSDVVYLASTVCHQRSTGLSEQDIIGAPRGRGVQMALAMVLGAEFHFCPAYATSYNKGS